MRYLFIGGAANGERIEVPANRDQWFISAIQPLQVFADPIDRLEVSSIRSYEYRAMPWTIDGEKEYLFVLKGMTPRDVWTVLIASYQTHATTLP
jgi:hypothetical protein